MSHIIAESSFGTPLSEEEENKGARAIDKSLEGRGAHWVRSYYSEDRRRMICEFEAPDAEAVVAAYDTAGMPLERCWRAEVFAVEEMQAG
jgi:hypothetical protein